MFVASNLCARWAPGRFPDMAANQAIDEGDQYELSQPSSPVAQAAEEPVMSDRVGAEADKPPRYYESLQDWYDRCAEDDASIEVLKARQVPCEYTHEDFVVQNFIAMPEGHHPTVCTCWDNAGEKEERNVFQTRKLTTIIEGTSPLVEFCDDYWARSERVLDIVNDLDDDGKMAMSRADKYKPVLTDDFDIPPIMIKVAPGIVIPSQHWRRPVSDATLFIPDQTMPSSEKRFAQAVPSASKRFVDAIIEGIAEIVFKE